MCFIKIYLLKYIYYSIILSFYLLLVLVAFLCYLLYNVFVRIIHIFNFKEVFMEFSVNQERYSACLVCPSRCGPCRKTNCSPTFLDNLRKSRNFHEQILSVCHWLYDDDLSYFKIRDNSYK